MFGGLILGLLVHHIERQQARLLAAPESCSSGVELTTAGFEKNQPINNLLADMDTYGVQHELRTPNEGINQRYLKNWADVADKICFGRT